MLGATLTVSKGRRADGAREGSKRYTTDDRIVRVVTQCKSASYRRSEYQNATPIQQWCTRHPTGWRFTPATERRGGIRPRCRNGSKTNGHTAHDVLWRTHNLHFVVDGGFEQIFLKQVSNRDDHLPLRRGEVEKRQRLTHLDVEPRSKPRPKCGGIRTGETPVQLVNDLDWGIEPRALALDRGRQVVQLLELPAHDRWHHERDA